MNILITGYTGFIGTKLTGKLLNENLSGVDILKNDSVDRHFWWNEIDQIKDIDCVVHLAAKVHDTEDITSSQEYFDINLGLTQKIFNLFLSSSASKFVFFSSVKAVTDSFKGEQLTEESKCNPKTPYGLSKLAAEQYILNKPLINNKKVYILRPCMIYGSGNKGNLNILFKMQQKGLPWPLGEFENRRSFCSIDNLLFVVQQLIYGNIESGVYNISDDDPLSTNDLIRLMAISRNRNAKIWRVPKKIIESIASIGDILHLPLNNERLKKLSESYIVSNEKIKDVLGIKRMPFSSIIELQKTFESLKK